MHMSGWLPQSVCDNAKTATIVQVPKYEDDDGEEVA